MSRLKFLWKSGCGEMWNSMDTCGVPVGFAPNSTRRKRHISSRKRVGDTRLFSLRMSRIICCCSTSVAPSKRSVMACCEKPSLYICSMVEQR